MDRTDIECLNEIWGCMDSSVKFELIEFAFVANEKDATASATRTDIRFARKILW